MRKTLLIILCLLLVGCNSKKIEPNGNVVYNHLSLMLDETNWYQNVGHADYVFVAEVIELKENIIEDNIPKSFWVLKVVDNLKGELVEDVEVQINAGYLKDGTLVLNQTDFTSEEDLPQVGKTYIFLGYGQSDGRLVIAQMSGYREYSAELKKTYLEYIENQVEYNRERFKSKYDK